MAAQMTLLSAFDGELDAPYARTVVDPSWQAKFDARVQEMKVFVTDGKALLAEGMRSYNAFLEWSDPRNPCAPTEERLAEFSAEFIRVGEQLQEVGGEIENMVLAFLALADEMPLRRRNTL